VSPLTKPRVASVRLTNGVLVARITGDFGPDYRVQASTNLAAWTTVSTNNSPVLPFDWTDASVSSYPARFYRVLLGP
jgi:hypothetical protein